MYRVIQITEEGEVDHGLWPTEEGADALIQLIDSGQEYVWLFRHEEKNDD
jgi:hypothetical protein